jgi:MscS family membrane protein
MKMIDLLPSFGLQGESELVLHVFIVVFITMLANYLVLSLLAQLDKQLKKTKNIWDDILVLSAKKPLSLLIWVVGVSWASEMIADTPDSIIIEIAQSVRKISVIVLLAWFVIDGIRRAEHALTVAESEEKPVDKTTVTVIAKLLRISVIITAGLILMQTLGYSVSGVLAFGGIGGIAIGFAAKDLLANFFGGLMIYLDRPFSIGEWVRSPDRNIEGTVEYIGWRLTRIRTFDKRPLYVPNATFTSITVENPSRMTHRRIHETIGIRYEDADKMVPIVTEIEAMLRADPEIDSEQTLMVNFNTYGASSLDFFVYTFTKTVNWVAFHKVKQDVLVKIMDIILKHGAEVAFPTSTLHLAGENTPPLLPASAKPQEKKAK